MTPVQQTDTSSKRGDCQRAAVASLFDLEIGQVPNFRLFSEDRWWSVFCGFIWGMGYEVIATIKDPEDLANFKLVGVIDNLLLASTTSSYGGDYSHMVVANIQGKIIHDPMPNNPLNGINLLAGDILVWWPHIVKRPEEKSSGIKS